jgi:hypothetical protein
LNPLRPTRNAPVPVRRFAADEVSGVSADAVAAQRDNRLVVRHPRCRKGASLITVVVLRRVLLVSLAAAAVDEKSEENEVPPSGDRLSAAAVHVLRSPK